MKKADLHVHGFVCDGSSTPDEIAKIVVQDSSLKHIAPTGHNTHALAILVEKELDKLGWDGNIYVAAELNCDFNYSVETPDMKKRASFSSHWNVFFLPREGESIEEVYRRIAVDVNPLEGELNKTVFDKYTSEEQIKLINDNFPGRPKDSYVTRKDVEEISRKKRDFILSFLEGINLDAASLIPPFTLTAFPDTWIRVILNKAWTSDPEFAKQQFKRGSDDGRGRGSCYSDSAAAYKPAEEVLSYLKEHNERLDPYVVSWEHPAVSALLMIGDHLRGIKEPENRGSVSFPEAEAIMDKILRFKEQGMMNGLGVFYSTHTPEVISGLMELVYLLNDNDPQHPLYMLGGSDNHHGTDDKKRSIGMVCTDSRIVMPSDLVVAMERKAPWVPGKGYDIGTKIVSPKELVEF
ncbi:hypothetical protein KY331_00630 [Candidatus Woesearchaeota archaeon]|nr:hypothetical protein [Candidatus Woesearchaeota archaeon]